MEKQIKYVQVSADNAENCKVYESLMYEYIDEMNEHSERPLPKEFQQKWTNSIIAMQGPTERSFSALVIAIFLRTLKPFDYSIAATYAKDTAVPEGFRRNTIPARTWAVFECKGAMPNAIQDVWHKIVSEFFPTSSYKPTYEMDIEAYSEGNMGDPDYYSEIWIPVVKK